MKPVYRIALAGNPNCGKTTVFNLLTGTRQHVGNYPGVTVERKSGRCRIGNLDVELIDLPGIYGLSSSSPEEQVAFRELLETKIDLIFNIIDAGNPQRNLYLTTQLAELNIPMLLVFNMVDDARNRGLEFDYAKLERYFGAKIVETVGSDGEGIDKLKETAQEILETEPKPLPVRLHYGETTDAAIEALTRAVEALQLPQFNHIPARYFAIKLLENDEDVGRMPEFAPVLEEAASRREKLTARHGINHETFMADCRYGMIAGACREAIHINNEQRRQISDNIDKVATNRYLGVPIFLIMMLLVFAFTFTCGEPLMQLLDFFFSGLADFLSEYWPATFLPFVKSLVIEGIIGGVGSVLSFLPNILLLFLAIAFLEGTGYMARAAFVMDGFMHKFGLHGKSFIPMLLGFGCSVPAVMATRTIESERDRLTTILILPLMSCGARLPIYALIIPAFFPENFQAMIMWVIYLIGIALALGCAVLLKSTLFRGEDEVFVMELPPYRMPTMKSLLIHMWERTVMYLRKAGTLILTASVLLYVINTFPEKKTFDRDYDAAIAAVEQRQLPEEEQQDQIQTLRAERQSEILAYSLAGRIGKGLEVVMHPLGFDWRVSSALIGAFAAKELFVSQLGILYSVGEANEASLPLRTHLQENYTPLQGFCIMLFCLVSMPCIATVAVVRRETNSWTLTLLQVCGLTLMAYLLTLIVYQAGSFFELGTHLIG
ncbi:ferrous iron transport protein B [Victivallis sp. Marseille-Q1083]|uniref:ferrous iron transport protein B n=1 Tax=Victivallis sp. Marseille-Q1083 TaxID=2717288 RepID=UPI00158988F6|nr:ferrous iron transport protein B [Victivallis sp. Marseille-Q1083]